MPTDREWDKYYNSIDDWTYKEKEKMRTRLKKEFLAMSNEEKIDYLVNQYIENKVYKQFKK